MKTSVFVHSALAAALLASGAAHATVNLPSSGNGDIWIFVEDTTTTVTYARDTGIQQQTVLTQAAVQGSGVVAGTVLANQPSGLPSLISADTTLTSYLSAHSGDNFVWAFAGGSGSTGANASQADQLFITDNANTIASSFLKPNNKGVNAMTGLNGTANSIATSGLLLTNGTHSNSTDFTAPSAANGLPSTTTGFASWYDGANTGLGPFVATTGAPTSSTVAQLYAVANSSATQLSKADVLQLGSAYMDASGNLHISAFSAVPLPAGVWLLGSGLLGLMGVSRRRREMAAA